MTNLERICITLAIFAACSSAGFAQTFQTVHTFQGIDGTTPYGPLVQVGSELYGVTSSGGVQNGGTVFAMTAAGNVTTLYSFCSVGAHCSDGLNPMNGLTLGKDGNLYGTTAEGGLAQGYTGYGTVFRITPNGVLTTLHRFQGTDGSVPLSLVQGNDGNFYGTTALGGNGGQLCSRSVRGDLDCGTVFQITPAGMLTTIHTFCMQANCPDGAIPAAGLVQAPDGSLYGTTSFGGISESACDGTCGTAFRISSDGSFTVLHEFDSADGSAPRAPLLAAKGGVFYGTTSTGGANFNAGTVFRMTRGGAVTTIYDFCSEGGENCTDGANPQSGLIQDPLGTLYGTTEFGGGSQGSVFSLTTGGVLVTLHDFTHGDLPITGLTRGSNGLLYGTTYGGGTTGMGTVYSISLAPSEVGATR